MIPVWGGYQGGSIRTSGPTLILDFVTNTNYSLSLDFTTQTYIMQQGDPLYPGFYCDIEVWS